MDSPRPCPWISCKYHLALDVSRTGSLWSNAEPKSPTLKPEATTQTVRSLISQVAAALSTMPETCALDVADRGDNTLHEVGGILGLSRERVRQIEAAALTTARRRLSGTDVAQAIADDLSTMERIRSTCSALGTARDKALGDRALSVAGLDDA